jgi:hypothetical protein
VRNENAISLATECLLRQRASIWLALAVNGGFPPFTTNTELSTLGALPHSTFAQPPSLTPGKRKAKAMRLRQDGVSGSSITPSRS